MRSKKNGGIIMGPILVLGAILCLWENEGRFDYYKAAKKAQVLLEPTDLPSGQTSSFTGELGPLKIGGSYIEKIPGYLQIIERAEIYSWNREEDDDGVTWRQGWYPYLQPNERNNGLRQTLEGATWNAKEYSVGDFTISGLQLHFVDESVSINTSNAKLNKEGRQIGLTPQGSVFYKKNPQGGTDRLGDERLRILGIPAEKTVSYFGMIRKGKATGKKVETKEGLISKIIQDDGILHHLVNGDRDTALAALKSHIQRLRWIVRFAATVAIIIGQLAFWGKLMHLLIAIPYLGRLVGAGIFMFSVIVGLTISLSVILLSMIFHNLIVALIVVSIFVGGCIYISRAKKRSSEQAKAYLQHSEIPVQASDETKTDSMLMNAQQQIQLHHVFKNLVKISLVDGELSKQENDFLANWARSRGISDEQIVALFDEAKKTNEEDLEATSYDDLHHLITLSMLDGTMSTQELKHIVNFGGKLGMNQQQVHSTIKRATLGELGTSNAI